MLLKGFFLYQLYSLIINSYFLSSLLGTVSGKAGTCEAVQSHKCLNLGLAAEIQGT